MPPLSGRCAGCGWDFDDVTKHQSSNRCYPRLVSARRAWADLTDAVRCAASARDVASLERQFTESLARYT